MIDLDLMKWAPYLKKWIYVGLLSPTKCTKVIVNATNFKEK